MAIARPERRLPFVAFLNPNKVEGTPEVYLSIDPGAQEAVQGL